VKAKWLLLAALVFAASGAKTAAKAADSHGLAPRALRSDPVSIPSERDLIRAAFRSVGSREGGELAAQDGTLRLYLQSATGSLTVSGWASCDTYQAYFHVPIPFHEQAPLLLDIDCPDMIDYRFVREDPPNLLVAARMLNTSSTQIDWTCWVLVKENSYPDFPTYVPIPTPSELPDSVRQWLDTTDCCQVSDLLVQSTADSLRDTTSNLMKVAQDVCDYCYDIPWEFPHQPSAFDAVYALKWGNSCTGRAHAAAALLRACGIPARTLLNMPVSSSSYDMHWIIDYYVPGYGWVRMESSSGINPMQPQNELVVRACHPGDECPVWFPCAIDAEWHTSDTAFGMWAPDWGRAHGASAVLSLTDSSERVDHAIALTDSVNSLYTSYWGIKLTAAESSAFQAGLDHQTMAWVRIQRSNLPDYINEMHEALLDYQSVGPAPVETLFSEDFESGSAGWTHGGTQDEWELGVPTFGPANAHSGQNCWGTDLDAPYANNTDCWLESPPVDLSGFACADLSFWIWNSVQDVYGQVYDPVWVEISIDGAAFRPLSSRMGGVNDDPEITAVGGWSRVFLDLFQYLGDTVQFRFRFRSDGSTVFAGSYIEDVQVTGRRTSAGVAEGRKPQASSPKLMPTIVRGVLFLPTATSHKPQAASLMDITGRKVLDLKAGANDVRRLAAGVYFVRAVSREPSAVSCHRVVLTR